MFLSKIIKIFTARFQVLFDKMGVVRKTISINEEQERWLKDNNISLSQLVQSEIEARARTNPGGIQTKMEPTDPRVIRKNSIMSFQVTVLGIVALLFGLWAPSLAGVNPMLGALVAVVGGAVTFYGIRETRYWQRRG